MSEPSPLEAIFFAALEKAPAQRAAYLQEACAGDEVLRNRVQRMLSAQAEAASFLESPAAPVVGDAHATLDQPASERPGTQIGPYKLLQQIGEGGMGVVYMAEQEQPVRRHVALKIIKPGMDTRQVIARFEAERQALSLMDHPNIAKVLDAGEVGPAGPGPEKGDGSLLPERPEGCFAQKTPVPFFSAGRPYFVMELVRGTPITQYCDDHHLTPRQRLELLVPVCQAIQHAHQKGIIHRDIKPTNILVAEYDEKPVPKVIDFGVAKAIGSPLTEKTMFTGFGQLVGTLEYMSPEQAKVNQLDIDTRSDIYSLGVLMYELLTGSTPFDKHRLRSAAWDEMLRIIREEEPEKPSTRLSRSGSPSRTSAAIAESTGDLGSAGPAGPTLASIAAVRGTEPAKLTKLLRGELDWIVMKALDKDRTRRYETAGGLSRDLERYLNDEQVLACPPSVGYRLRKFARKHRGVLAAAAAILTVLLVGLSISIWQAVRATRAEAAAVFAAAEKERARVAEAEQRGIAEANEKIAKDRESEAQAALDFLENRILAAARPEGQEGGLGHDVTLRRAVINALPYVESSFQDQPLIAARLHMTAGWSLISLGEWKLAAQQYEQACSIRTQQLGQDHLETFRSMRELAAAYNFLQRYSDALPLVEAALAGFKVQLSPDDDDTLSALGVLATTLAGLGRTEEALALREQTLALEKAKLGHNDSGTFVSRINLATSYAAVGRHSDALKLNQETLARLTAAHGPHHPPTLLTKANLAGNLMELGRLEEALKVYEEVLPLQREKMGLPSPYTQSTMRRLAGLYVAVGRHAEAIALAEEVAPLLTERLGADHRETLGTMHNLANSYGAVGRLDDALKLNEENVARMKDKLGPTDSYTLMAMNNLGNVYAALGRYSDALQVRKELLALREAKLGPDQADTLRSMLLVGWSHIELKDYAAAEAILLDRQARVEKNAANLPAEWQTIAIPRFIELYELWGKPEEAEKWRAKAAASGVK